MTLVLWQFLKLVIPDSEPDDAYQYPSFPRRRKSPKVWKISYIDSCLRRNGGVICGKDVIIRVNDDRRGSRSCY